MKAIEFRDKLNKLIEEHGDLEVKVWCNHADSYGDADISIDSFPGSLNRDAFLIDANLW